MRSNEYTGLHGVRANSEAAATPSNDLLTCSFCKQVSESTFSRKESQVRICSPCLTEMVALRDLIQRSRDLRSAHAVGPQTAETAEAIADKKETVTILRRTPPRSPTGEGA